MKKEGYEIDFAAAATATSSTIGPVILPSISISFTVCCATFRSPPSFGQDLLRASFSLFSKWRWSAITRKNINNILITVPQQQTPK
jgi:hypothetical protein